MVFCRLHSSPELFDHLVLKGKAALRRQQKLQVLRHMGRLLLLICTLAGAYTTLHQRPDLPKDALETMKAALPFHHYTGRLKLMYKSFLQSLLYWMLIYENANGISFKCMSFIGICLQEI